jgi:hypothetical protein
VLQHHSGQATPACLKLNTAGDACEGSTGAQCKQYKGWTCAVRGQYRSAMLAVQRLDMCSTRAVQERNASSTKVGHVEYEGSTGAQCKQYKGWTCAVRGQESVVAKIWMKHRTVAHCRPVWKPCAVMLVACVGDSLLNTQPCAFPVLTRCCKS